MVSELGGADAHDLRALLAAGRTVLTDGAVETRIMFETNVELPAHVEVAGLVGTPELRAVYADYVEAAREQGLPLIIGTPTFRAGERYARAAGEDVVGLNAAAGAHHRELVTRSGYDGIIVAGVIGPYGDAYTPEEALDAAHAERYHAIQARALAGGVDLLYAATFPEVGEALGAARALGTTGLPYVISFVLDRDGRVLDGTQLADAVARIDSGTDPAPLFFSLSCVHPTVADRALARVTPGRLLECKANASPLTPAELVGLDHIEADDPARFAADMWGLHERHGLPVLGGCCGTDARHIRALGALMASAA